MSSSHKRISGSPSYSKVKKERLYYGWIVLAACLFIGFISFGMRYSFGVFFESLEKEFGWTRALTSGVFSVHMVLSSLFSALGGWALDRYGAKIIICLMGFFTGLGLILAGQANSLWHLFASFSVLFALGTGATYTVIMATASRWFVRRRGLALGIAGSGIGIGMVVVTPISAYLISSYGWRTAFWVMGIVAILTIIPSAVLLMREEALSENEKIPVTGSPSPQAQGHNEPTEFSLLGAAKTGNFWTLASMWFLFAFCLFLVLTHIVRHAIDLDIIPIEAATILSLLGGTSILGRLLLGRVSDSIGRKRAGIVCTLLIAAAMLWLIGSSNLWMLYIFAVVFGVFYGGFESVNTALAADTFGLRHLGAIMGALSVAWGAGAAFGPALAGHIFDVNGNYVLAFVAGMTAMLITAALPLAMRRSGTSSGSN